MTICVSMSALNNWILLRFVISSFVDASYCSASDPISTLLNIGRSVSYHIVLILALYSRGLVIYAVEYSILVLILA